MSKNKILQLYNAGNFNDCIALALKSLKKDPNDLFIINLLIRLYLNINNLDYALFYFNKSLILDARQEDVLFNYSVTLDRIGNYPLAIKIVDEYLALHPSDENALINRGFYLRNNKNYKDAIESFQSALSINKNNNLCYISIGYIHYLNNDNAVAIEFYNKALSINPNFAEAYLNRGLAFSAQDKLDEAINDYNKALSINPNFAEAYLNRGMISYKLNKYNESMSDYNTAITLNPSFINVYHNRGLLFTRLGQHREAIKNFEKILSLDTNNFEAYLNIGDNYKYLREYSHSINSYEKSIASNKDCYAAYWNLAVLLLKINDMRRGWNYYEYRIKNTTYRSNLIANQPCWQIDSNTSNKILLIHPDGGFGDFIQFYRFVLITIKLFKKVVLRCPLPLFELLESNNSFQALELIKVEDKIPHFDYQCLIMSLPHLTKYEESFISKFIPYIKPNPSNLNKWSQLFLVKHVLKVGICWQGTQRDELDNIPGQNRSIPLNVFKALFALPMEFHILHLQISKEDLSILNNYKNIVLYTDHILDFADTASIIHHLDIVISIDTALVHLCGAMNKETWVLLPYLSDYRWGEDSDDFSPWYNSHKLYRQKESHDWGDMLETVKINLSKLLI
jgi:tetratricopeptide (TPR) repeat protein